MSGILFMRAFVKGLVFQSLVFRSLAIRGSVLKLLGIVPFALVFMVCVLQSGETLASDRLAAESPPTELAGGVLVLGDSISAAYGIDKSLGWVALLERRLAQQCPGVAVHNASVSGETTAGGLLRLPDLLARLKPGLVVIELGGNDGLRGLSPVQMQRNFADMISLVRAAGAEPVLLGILIPPNYGETYRRLFEQAIADVARDDQVVLLDFFLTGVAEHEELMQDDGIHPTAEAQPILLSNAEQVLEAPLQTLCGSLDLSARQGL